MDLFNHQNSEINLLPFDGTLNYYGQVLNKKESDHYFELLMNQIPWKNDELVIFGKKLITSRKVAWYGDSEFEYTYSNITKRAMLWYDTLLELKALVEELSNEKYNSCLLNLYHNGNEGMAWHSDDEKELKPNAAIASLSFGAERKFLFKHKSHKQKIDLILEHGSLLLMKDEIQTYWLHRLPPTTKIQKPRINLTFRTIVIR